MTTLTISDEILREAGLDGPQAIVEFACRLFDAGKLTLQSAGKLAGLERGQMESELLVRKISIYRPTVDDVRNDVAALERLGM